jgi:hypothetical protein
MKCGLLRTISKDDITVQQAGLTLAYGTDPPYLKVLAILYRDLTGYAMVSTASLK